MTIYRAMSVLKTTSGVSKDWSVNTHHIDVALTAPDLMVALGHFRDYWQIFQRANIGIYPTAIATTGHELRFYRLTDPKPRTPVLVASWSFAGAPGGTALPSEVCIVVSHQADPLSGVKQARRRGRFYMGPLQTTVNSAGRPNTSFTGTMISSLNTFATSCRTDPDFEWGVYSTIGETAFSVSKNGWIDDAFDIQRRRGAAPTSRLVTAWS